MPVKHEAKKRPPLTILLFEANGIWLAQALERDVAASGTTRLDAIVGLCASIEVHIAHDEELNRKPLSRLPRAPKRFHDLAKAAWPTSPPELPLKIGAFQPCVKWVSSDSAAASI